MIVIYKIKKLKVRLILKQDVFYYISMECEIKN